MPTGYTAIFTEREVTFREYALRCARAFGACILQRDDDVDQPPKHREEASYYQESVDRDMRELDRFLSLTREQQVEELEAKAEESRQYRIKSQRERTMLEARLREVLGQVSAWKAPTQEHENYKKFMIDQINSTLDFDCGYREYTDPTKVKAATPAEHLAELKQHLDYSITGRDEERERCRQANDWIDALYASLPEAP